MLDRILEQSESYRKKVAVGLTFIISIVIFSAWLMIAGHNMQTATQIETNETQVAQQFQQNLPSLRQEKTVRTELEKQGVATNAKEVVPEENRSFFDKILGN